MGYPDGTIRPDGHVSREEAATLFFRLLSEETRDKMIQSENSYSDVEEGRWSSTAISTLSGMGVVEGYADGMFHPAQTITRAEFAVFASRFDNRALQELPGFADTQDHWAGNEISRVVALGWISGDADGNFRPDAYITRAEVASMVNRMLQRSVDSEDALLEDMKEWADNMDRSKWYYYDLQEAANSHDYERAADGTGEKWTSLREDPDWKEWE